MSTALCILLYNDVSTYLEVCLTKEKIFNPYSTELVFQITSHFQHWRLYCIYFGHHSLSLSQTWLLFRHGALLLPTCLPGLESPQVLCRIKSNAVLSLF